MNILMALVVGSVLYWAPYTDHIEELERTDVLALIFVESTGDENARRQGSQYYGLLQISDAYMQDALEYAGREVQGVEVLIGDGERSLQVFYWYMQRYEFLHGWDAERVALLHKMGPGAMRGVNARMDKGNTLEEAVKACETPGAYQYLMRYREVRRAYERESISGET